MKPTKITQYQQCLIEINDTLKDMVSRFGGLIMEPIEVTLLRCKRIYPTGYNQLRRNEQVTRLDELAFLIKINCVDQQTGEDEK